MLGQQCNLSCDYCLQHDMIQEEIKVDNINEDIFKFFELNASNNKIDITFYGGEPLLYYEALKYIAQKIRPHVNRMSVITNGKRMTEDMVRFFNDMDMYVAISWDGKNTILTRHYDAFKEKKELLLKIKKLGVNSVSSSMCYPLDYYEEANNLAKEYAAVTKTNGLSIGNELLINTPTCKSYLAEIDYDKLERQMAEICKRAQDELASGHYSFYANKFLSTVDIYDETPEHALCGNPVYTLNIDLQGNLYECHNTWTMIGSIYDTEEEYMSKINDHTKETCQKHCIDCKVKAICKGGCPVISWEEREKSNYCKYRRAYYGPFVDMLNKMVDNKFLYKEG